MNKLIHVNYSKKRWPMLAVNIYQMVIMYLSSILRSPGPTAIDELSLLTVTTTLKVSTIIIPQSGEG